MDLALNTHEFIRIYSCSFFSSFVLTSVKEMDRFEASRQRCPSQICVACQRQHRWVSGFFSIYHHRQFIASLIRSVWLYILLVNRLWKSMRLRRDSMICVFSLAWFWFYFVMQVLKYESFYFFIFHIFSVPSHDLAWDISDISRVSSFFY